MIYDRARHRAGIDHGESDASSAILERQSPHMQFIVDFSSAAVGHAAGQRTAERRRDVGRGRSGPQSSFGAERNQRWRERRGTGALEETSPIPVSTHMYVPA